ncbi:uncharacterized protein F4822DRAFT_427237 [Hypoxylon trugodes]|uniref:uncharacterized protein n=1 Tax=Hypoxylon trugodes TaxID=326681 RepID=UPI00218D951F|nr:uncharacterized protein F4822DRAFT_427237 [Hypoxylon trugodes]KAI1391388.1 hypothetical protein F4822DRAFT_427237 [Hypoxylon trugodes]
MDPVSAIGLAASIFGCIQAGQKFNQFLHSGLEMIHENAELQNITDELRRTVQGLTADGPSELKLIANNCNALCQELLSLLQRLKMKRDSTLERGRVYIYALWKKSDITSMVNRLERHRSQLTTSFLPHFKDQQSAINQKLDTLQNDLRQFHRARSEEFAEYRSSLIKLLEMYNGSTQAGVDIGGQLDMASELHDLLLKFPKVSVVTLSDRILMPLRFEGIYRRKDEIGDATKGTCIWALEGATGDHHPNERLRESKQYFTSWLESGSGVFHISGKAGCGKSTLMKFISSHPKTQAYLKKWAGTRKLCLATFFFNGSGIDEQRSLIGLLRSILYIVLKENEDLALKVFPEYFNENQHTSRADPAEITRPQNIERAFETLINHAGVEEGCCRLFFLVDGLDEYEADSESHWQLARKLCKWADQSQGNVKFCVSSRPHVQYESTFGLSEHPQRHQLHLHELNSYDIENHCRRMFIEAIGSTDLPRPHSDLQVHSQYLVQEIVHRAEGVFIWAYLVVRIIISEARVQGMARDLMKKLKELPRDMDNLYEKMIGALSYMDRKIAHRILFIVLTNPFKDAVSALCLRWLVDEDKWREALNRNTYDRKEAEHDIEYVRFHLDGWTRGLVEMVPSSSYRDLLLTNRVKLFHGTVKEYLMQQSRLHLIQSDCSEYPVSDLHTRLRLAELKVMSHNSSEVDREIYKYGFELLDMKFSELPTYSGVRLASSRISWPHAMELAEILPSYCKGCVFGHLSMAVLSKKHNIRRSDRTSLPHLAALLGQSYDVISALQINVPVDPESNSRSILLSACLSNEYFKAYQIGDRAVSRNIIKSLLKRGFSAREKIKLQDSRSCQWADVWTILVWRLALQILFSVERSQIECQIEVLLELLENEEQEETLVLLVNNIAQAFSWFITLKDLLLHCVHPDTSAQIFHRLSSWPNYDHDIPTWVLDRSGRIGWPIAKKLTKPPGGDINGIRIFSTFAIVTKSVFLEVYGFPSVLLW